MVCSKIKLTLLIYIRSHDLRIASDCERDSLMQKPVPHAAVQTIKKKLQRVYNERESYYVLAMF